MRHIQATYTRIRALAIATSCAAAVIALGLAAATAPVRGQERPTTTAGAERATRGQDAAPLAAFGLELGSIEQVEDVALLWRAVRELVLPGKVSETTQQRLLRRVWATDPDIRHGSYIDSPAH